MSPLLPAALLGLAVLVVLSPPSARRAVLAPGGTAARTPLGRTSAAALVCAALVVPAGPVAASLAGALTWSGLRAREARARARDRREERAAALEALGVLAAELRAGRPPAVALGRAAEVATGPVARALSEAARERSLGEGGADALRRHVEESAVPEMLTGLAVCWEVCQGAGSSIAAAVDRLEEALLADQVCREEVEADLEGPRTSALLLSVMPVFGLALGSGLGGHPLHVLLRTPVGWGCLVIGTGLELLGLWWTARIVRAAGGAE